MFNWKSHLQAVLVGLVRTHATAPLTEIQRILRGVLDVEDVSFLDRLGRDLAGETALQDALEKSCRVIVRLQCVPADSRPLGSEPAPTPQAGEAESRFREGAVPAETADISADTRYEDFLHEFLRLEQRHDFMWAGYIVRELLPRLGFAPNEAKSVLDRLRAENLVTISKVANPKNPDFPATGVHLNRDHPRVKALLGEEAPVEEVPTEEAATGDAPAESAAVERTAAEDI